jgi:hypothetical protein
MSLFCRRKDLSVQSFVLKLVNNNCPGLIARVEGARVDSRVNLVVVVIVIPLGDGKPQTDQAFTAVTKEFSNSGVAVVLNQPHRLDQAILGFRFEGKMTFLRAQVKHRDPMGGRFHQLGFQMSEVVSLVDYPELELMSF